MPEKRMKPAERLRYLALQQQEAQAQLKDELVAECIKLGVNDPQILEQHSQQLIQWANEYNAHEFQRARDERKERKAKAREAGKAGAKARRKKKLGASDNLNVNPIDTKDVDF